MEWAILITWLMIINGALGGQYILNWMGNQERFVGDKPVGVSPGVMTWWRELSKLLWAVIAVIIELIKGKKVKYFWPGIISLITIIICAFTGVIENIGFFYLPRYYSPHLYAPYVSIYLAFLPFFGKFLFNSPIRKEHWIGVILVVIGLTVPYLPVIIGGSNDPNSVFDSTAIIWIIIINLCLMSQQVLNNKTVQTAKPNVTPNALVVWREIWKMIFITSALLIVPVIGSMVRVNIPETVKISYVDSKFIKPDSAKITFLYSCYDAGNREFVKRNLGNEAQLELNKIFSSIPYMDELPENQRDTLSASVFKNRIEKALVMNDSSKIKFLLKYYQKADNGYVLKSGLDKNSEKQIESFFSSIGYNRFFALFEGNILPKNWWPILFVVLAGLSGYIYSFGFFKLARFAAHLWVPYTNVYLAIIPFIMFLFGQDVTVYQIIGAGITTAGLMVGISDYKRHKVDEIEKTYKEEKQ